MNTSLKQSLQEVGLSEKEVAVYLASLEIGSASVQDIAKKAGVNRATTYVMIEALSERGLMSTFVKEKKRYYRTENPERLVSMIRLQQEALKVREEEMAGLLPALLALYQKTHQVRPEIRYLEGEEGLQTVREMFLKLQGEFVQLVPYEEVKKQRVLHQSQGEHHQQLAQEAIPHRALIVVKDFSKGDLPKLPGGEVRVLSQDKFPLKAEITIREDHVLIVSYGKSLLSVVMVSQEIADSLRILFELGWKGSEER